MANDINKYKNIIQNHEDNHQPVWNKKHNWHTIESKARQKRSPKQVHNWVYLGLLLLGFAGGWILKPVGSIKTNQGDHIIQNADTILREYRVMDTLIATVTDTLMMYKNKVVPIYDTVYMVTERFSPPLVESTDSTDIKISTIDSIDEQKSSSEWVHMDTLEVDDQALREKVNDETNTPASPVYTKRTQKEYAPYVFIKDTLQSKSIDIQFDLFRRRQFFVDKYVRQ